MKKTYVNPDVEVLDLSETECFWWEKPKEIYSSNGEVIGYEKPNHNHCR